MIRNDTEIVGLKFRNAGHARHVPVVSECRACDYKVTHAAQFSPEPTGDTYLAAPKALQASDLARKPVSVSRTAFLDSSYSRTTVPIRFLPSNRNVSASVQTRAVSGRRAASASSSPAWA